MRDREAALNVAISVVLIGLVLMLVAPMAGLSNAVASGADEVWGDRFFAVFAITGIVPLVTILALEHFFPAVEQPRFGPGFFMDAIYFFISQPLAWWAFAVVAPATYEWTDANIGWAVYDGAKSWPVWLSGLVAFLIADFLFWFRHLLRHKIPYLWRFHAIHHSQTEFNLFTDRRVHLVDTLFSKLIGWLPLLIVGPDLRTYAVPVAAAGMIISWYPIFYHANIRTDMGPLRWVLITPQSHRIHHSRELKHFDRNYGIYLSIWDRMFRTYSGDKDDYPMTGVYKTTLPMETSRHPAALVRTYVAQFIHPFRVDDARPAELDQKKAPAVAEPSPVLGN